MVLSSFISVIVKSSQFFLFLFRKEVLITMSLSEDENILFFKFNRSSFDVHMVTSQSNNAHNCQNISYSIMLEYLPINHK